MEKLLLFFGITPKWNAFAWKSYWTTKLSAIQFALGSAAVAFGAMPPEWKTGLPSWLGVALGGATIVIALLTPPAAAAQQPKLVNAIPPPES